MGDPNHPPVLLIMGLGAQLLLWRKEFCEKIVDQGLRVIRYDNRDVGLSSKMTGRRTGAPRRCRAWSARSSASASPAVYTLEDLADDAAALLDHLDIDRAHIVGASMGGMIAQIFAARFPQRTKTLGDHLLQQQPGASAAAGIRAAARPAPAARRRHPRSDRRQRRTGRQDHRQPRLPALRGRAAGRRDRGLRTRLLPGRASRGTSPRCWAAAACCATTARSPRRPW